VKSQVIDFEGEDFFELVVTRPLGGVMRRNPSGDFLASRV